MPRSAPVDFRRVFGCYTDPPSTLKTQLFCIKLHLANAIEYRHMTEAGPCTASATHPCAGWLLDSSTNT